MAKLVPFIEDSDFGTPTRRAGARAERRGSLKNKLRLIRLVWSDTHGHARTKEVTIPAFLSALTGGYNINVATTTLDASGARTFASFTPGGGMGLEEMTGSPNLTIVPDPATFRVLPWAPGIGWVLCDEYFNTGMPFHFSPRQLLKKQLARLDEQKRGLMVGPRSRVVSAARCRRPACAGKYRRDRREGQADPHLPIEPGYSYHSESNFDIMQPVLTALCEHFESDRPAAALDRKRMGTGPGRMHVCAEGGADHRRQSDPVPQRDAPDHAPHGLSRKLHGATGDCRLLRQRLASASVDDRCGRQEEPVHAGEERRAADAARHELSRRPAAACAGRDALHHADHQRLSPLQAQFARARPRHLGL